MTDHHKNQMDDLRRQREQAMEKSTRLANELREAEKRFADGHVRDGNVMRNIGKLRKEAAEAKKAAERARKIETRVRDAHS